MSLLSDLDVSRPLSALRALILAGAVSFMLATGAQAQIQLQFLSQPQSQGQTQTQSKAPEAGVAPDLAEARAKLDGWKRELDQIEAGAREASIDDRRLQLLRDRLRPLIDPLQALVADLAPRAEALRERLQQLTPKGEEKDRPPESAEALREREERRKAFEMVDEALKRARSLLVQAEQTSAAIIDRRRDLFTQALFQRAQSVVSPGLWETAAEAFPQAGAAIASTFSSWFASLPTRLQGGAWAALAVTILIALLLMLPARRFATIALRRFLARRDKTRLTLALGAAGVAVTGLIAPGLGATIFAGAIEGFHVAPPRIARFIEIAAFGVVGVIVARSLVHAAFAPGWPELRLIAASDADATRYLKIATAYSIVLATARILEGAIELVAAPIVLSAAIKGLVSVALAAVLIKGLRDDHAREIADEEACFGPYTPPPGQGRPLIRVALWFAALAMLVSALAGYVTLGQFIGRQVAWIGGVLIIVSIVWAMVSAVEERLRDPRSALAGWARRGVGLSGRALEQSGVVLGGFARVVLVLVTASLLLAPWGVESRDLLGSLRAVLFGFQVGNVTVSLSTVALAIAVFALGVLATRAAQRWLESSLLPTTTMDAGLRNSIRTAFGYVGFFTAAAIALSSLGLSFDRLAIVAGALSVGIGFGLQSIVNNFVSGLILLWERPIRVGDWIVVGDEQGYVRRINVRSTEIETFDRASVIVPNSALISGPVKNRVLGDRSGRVNIIVGAAYGADPERVRDILVGCARGHSDVLTDPAPRAFFKNFGDSALEFELMAYIADVESGLRVASELRFAIYRAFIAEGFEIPYPQRDFNVKGLEKLERAMERIAERLNRETGERGASGHA